jgi:hypothetical protein
MACFTSLPGGDAMRIRALVVDPSVVKALGGDVA